MSEYINESADIFNEENKKPHIIIRILKWTALAIIIFICACLLYRCITAADHPITEKVIMNEDFLNLYKEDPTELKVHKYGMDTAWVSVDEGRLIQFDNLYYIPSLNQLQFSIKYNHDIVKADFTGIPFKLRLIDEEGNTYEDFFYETASRERFRYIRVCFKGIELEKEETGENGKALRHSYTLEIDIISDGGEYTPLCKYEVYDGDSGRSDVFANIPFEIE